MKSLLTVTLLFLASSSLFAQGTVSGTVIDQSSRKPIEFASIMLMSLPDSTQLKGTATDRRGRFMIEEIPNGTYILRYSYIGYEPKFSVAFSLTETTSSYQSGSTELLNTASNLSEVVVTSRKSMLNTGIDRKIYNVDQDIMSTSGSASDILKNVPSVEVDLDGQVSLRGSADVLILINGKPSPLMGTSRAEVLQQLPANSIERIEVITNPSAKYKPEGTSGIINIVLKKNVKNGFNGTVTANAGNRGRYNANLNLNYRPKNINLFFNYGFRNDNRRRFNDLERYYYDSTSGALRSYEFQNSTTVMDPFSHILSGGFDHTLNERSTWGISANYYYRDLVRKDIATYRYYDDLNILTEQYDRLRLDPEFELENGITSYLTHLFRDKEDHEINFEYSYSMDEEEEDNRFTIVHILPNLENNMENTLLNKKDKEHQLTIDYTNPISEESKIELGYDGNLASVDADLLVENFDKGQNEFLTDNDRSNHFIYNENVHALYATYQHSFDKWGFSAGLRGEQVFTKSNLVTLDSITRNSYFDLYPTLHFSFITGENSEMQLNYSRRVNRPDGDELNPFPEYSDPRNLYAGNPMLRPEFINSIELGYKWQNKIFSIVPSLYYRYRVNGFTSVTKLINDSVFLTTEENLLTDHSAGLELIFSAKPGKVVSINMSSNFFYNTIDATNLGFSNTKNILSLSTNINSNFNFKSGTAFQLGANYRSARLRAQGKTFPSFTLNTGFRQNLFKDKLALTLAVSDIFNSMRQRTELQTIYFKQESRGRRDGRVIYFGLSYRFGIIKKDKEEKLEFDEGM